MWVLILLLCIFIPLSMFIFTSLAPSDHGYPEISFESFKKFYNINPDRWEVHDEWVTCITEIKYDGFLKFTESFEFSYIDYQKYKKWLKNKREHDKNLKHMQSTAKMIAAVKQDIEKLERTSDAEINKAKSIIEILCEVK